MFGNILGRKKEDISEEDQMQAALIEKISKMNLTEMRSYIKNNIKDFEVTEEGLVAIMQRLTTEDMHTKKLYIQSDDMDSKKKKAFDLVLTIAQHKKINLEVVELIQKFSEIYKDIIDAFDREYKEIYNSRFVDAIHLGLANINKKRALANKMRLLNEQ